MCQVGKLDARLPIVDLLPTIGRRPGLRLSTIGKVEKLDWYLTDSRYQDCFKKFEKTIFINLNCNSIPNIIMIEAL